MEEERKGREAAAEAVQVAMATGPFTQVENASDGQVYFVHAGVRYLATVEAADDQDGV